MINPTMPSAQQLAVFGQDIRRLPGLIGLFGWMLYYGHSGVITDFCKRAQDRLLEQFENSPHLQNIVCIFLQALQECEIVTGDLMFERWLSNARGVQLDGIGEILGEARLGRLDETYRKALQFRIFANQYSGSPEEIISLLLNTLAEPPVIQLMDVFPAKLWVYVEGREVPSWVKDLIQDTLGAGIGLLLTYSDSSQVFGFEDDPLAYGFAEQNYEPLIGGKLVELVE